MLCFSAGAMPAIAGLRWIGELNLGHISFVEGMVVIDPA